MFKAGTLLLYVESAFERIKDGSTICIRKWQKISPSPTHFMVKVPLLGFFWDYSHNVFGMHEKLRHMEEISGRSASYVENKIYIFWNNSIKLANVYFLPHDRWNHLCSSEDSVPTVC